jgi:hypothetical protein
MWQELNKVNAKLDKMAATMCNKFTQLNDTLKEVSDKLNRLETVEASVRSLEHNKEINKKAQVNEVVQEQRTSNKGKSKKKGRYDSWSSPRKHSENVPSSEAEIECRREQPSSWGEDPLLLREEPSSWGEDPLLLREEPSPWGEDPLLLREEPSPWGEDPLLLREEPSPWGEDPVLLREEPSSWGEEPLSLAEKPSSWGERKASSWRERKSSAWGSLARNNNF